MSLARRVRAGIALHAGVNVVFAAVAAIGAAGGGAVVAEASEDPAGVVVASAGGGLPVHAVPPVHPLLGADDTATTTAATDTGSAAATTVTRTAAASTEREAREARDAGDAGEAGDDRDDRDDRDDHDDVRRVVSTGYCLRGTTASGVEVGQGMVAMNGVPLGTSWLVHDGPRAGQTFEVTDRIGHSTEFDIWFADCDDAVVYGRRTITIERVG